MAIDLAVAGGFGVIGDGGEDARRALVVGILEDVCAGRRSDRVFMTSGVLARLLGEHHARELSASSPAQLRLFASEAELERALDVVLRDRTYLLQMGDGADPFPGVVFIVDPELGAWQLQAQLARGEGLGVGAIVLGDWPYGTVAEVDTAGQVVCAVGTAHEELTGVRMPVMTQQEAAESVAAWYQEEARASREALTPEVQEPTVPGPVVRADEVQAPPGLIRLMGAPRIEGPHDTQVGKSAGMWLLLALFAEHRSALVTRSVVEAKVWHDGAPYDDAFNNLMRDSRAKLGDALGLARGERRRTIEMSGQGYRVNHRLYGYDVWRFRDLLGEAAQADRQERSRALEAAVDFYEPYLQGIDAHLSWIYGVAQQLTRDAVHALVDLAEMEREPDRAVLYLERATRIDCTNEDLFRQRMRIYGDLGRRVALRYCYEELDDALKMQGMSPDRQTIKLYQRLTSE